MVVDDEEGVSAQYMPSWAVHTAVEALAETAEVLLNRRGSRCVGA